jgi:ketosteroid isomerase-like protein
MKTLAWLLAAGCTVLMSGMALAGDGSGALREVEGVERARFKAFVAADIKSLQQMLADDLVYCHSTGQCQNKQEVVAALGSHQTIYHALDVVEMKPREVAGAVVITGTVNIRAEMGGKAAEFKAIYTDVYAKRDGRWQLVTWQSTRVP